MGGGNDVPPVSNTPLSIRVLTHNIRYATTSPFQGEELWTVRKPKLCAQLLYHARNLPTSIIFLQEALHAQREDVLECLNAASRRKRGEKWESVGVGRDDGKQAGEFAPIFFRGDVWRKVVGSEETVWLNESGEVGRRGWDAASVRILTTVVLDWHDGGGRSGSRSSAAKRVLFLNTHLDDQGSRSRSESAKLILRECAARRKKWDVDAVVLGGDLNSETVGDAYPIIANFEDSGVVDVRILANGEGVYGESNTFTGFDGWGEGEGVKRIDFLFLGIKREDDFETDGRDYAVLPNRFEDGVYLSDHRAVVADLVI